MKDEKLWAAIFHVAQAIGVEYMTAKKWFQRGFTPPSMHFSLVEGAKKAGVKLGHEELHAQWKRAKGRKR